jgi:hypothetical protein
MWGIVTPEDLEYDKESTIHLLDLVGAVTDEKGCTHLKESKVI